MADNMDFALRSGLHHREVDGAHILFDLTADRYSLLTGETAVRFERFISGRAADTDHAALFAQDLIAPQRADTATGRATFTVPAVSLVDDGLPDGGLPGTAAALWLMHRVRADLRRRRLASVLERLGRARPVATASDREVLIRVAAEFQRAGRFISLQEQCLVRGIAMTAALGRRGIRGSLVFGVTMPFAAHCWVQVGDQVLTDPLDIIRHYQPIFII